MAIVDGCSYVVISWWIASYLRQIFIVCCFQTAIIPTHGTVRKKYKSDNQTAAKHNQVKHSCFSSFWYYNCKIRDDTMSYNTELKITMTLYLMMAVTNNA